MGDINIPKITLPRVVVIGCGFAGLKFSKNIDSSKYQVVLIDKNNYHTFQPLMYQVASSGLQPDSIVYPIRKIFKGKPNFYFRLTEIQSIDQDKKYIETPIGGLDYDYLVIATGADTNFFGMKNIEKHALPMKNLIESLSLRSRIIDNFERALNTDDLKERERLMNFVIVGGGATGVELAGALAELKMKVLPADYPDLNIDRMQIHIVEAGSRVMSAMSEESSKKTAQYLADRGVNLWLNTSVKDFDGKTITTDQQIFQSETLIWAAGIKGQIPGGVQVETARGNRIVVNEWNEIKNVPDHFAIGDVACIQSELYPNGNPMLASVAEQQGKALAENFNRKAKGQKMKPFVYSDKGTMATIGRNKAVVELPFMKFGGFLGWVTWMFVHLMLLVDFRSRVIVFISWMWNYVMYDKSNRLIIRSFNKKN